MAEKIVSKYDLVVWGPEKGEYVIDWLSRLGRYQYRAMIEKLFPHEPTATEIYGYLYYERYKADPPDWAVQLKTKIASYDAAFKTPPPSEPPPVEPTTATGRLARPLVPGRDVIEEKSFIDVFRRSAVETQKTPPPTPGPVKPEREIPWLLIGAVVAGVFVLKKFM